jgi:hypothetical protein
MVSHDYEPTLVAAERQLVAGPFWLLDLWDRLPPALQQDVVATLATRSSFQEAVRNNDALLADLIQERFEDEFVFRLGEWLEEHELDREAIETLARRTPRETPPLTVAGGGHEPGDGHDAGPGEADEQRQQHTHQHDGGGPDGLEDSAP